MKKIDLFNRTANILAVDQKAFVARKKNILNSISEGSPASDAAGKSLLRHRLRLISIADAVFNRSQK